MKRIILILLTFIGTSYANFNLEWEVDVETFINSGLPTGYWEVDDYGMMEDEKVVLYIQPSYQINIEPMDETGYACVLDKNETFYILILLVEKARRLIQCST